MKTCIACLAINPDDDVICKKCGKPLPLPSPTSGATVRWTGQVPLPAQRGLGALVSLETLFRSSGRVVIGRGPECDVCLPHPTVSRYHAFLEQRGGRLSLRDLASINGVWVNGRRVKEPVSVAEGERIGIGPFLFSLRDGVIYSVDSSHSLRLEARGLEKIVPLGGGKTRKLLDNINLVVNPGEFVTLLGPSGSGKSTLMDCLNGRRRASAGRVLANGEDFYRHFNNFRQSLGYVPQKDIVHTGLTVYRALYYTARLRLPTDTAPGEFADRIRAVIDEMELGPHQETLIGNLSGGQIKRVSLGAELLAQPCLLYIDEATSGLDAGTEARMMRLFRRLADEGRSLICITHNVDNVDQCHLVLVLARGKLMFYGPPGEATKYFQVGRISEVYDRLAEKDAAVWENQFRACSLYQEFVGQRLQGPPAPENTGVDSPSVAGQAPAVRAPAEPAQLAEPMPAETGGVRSLTSRSLRVREWLQPVAMGWHQFRVLTRRYLDLIVGDAKGLRLLLLQAPIVGLFLLVGFIDKDFQAKVPVPRRLSQEERNMLQALAAAEGILTSKVGLPPDDVRGLKDIKMKLPIGDKVLAVDGADMVNIVRQLFHMPADAGQQELFEAARLTFADKAGGASLSLADLIRVFHKLHESKLVTRLKNFTGPLIPDREIVNPRYTYMLVFITVVVVLWFGCNNAAKEIVKEEAIYGRERSVNLGIIPYLGSKFLVMSLITVFHAFLLMLVLFGLLELFHVVDPQRFGVPAREYRLAYVDLFGVLCLLAMTGTALGLMLSACVATPDRANALLPYVLIPQLILGGGFLSVGEGLLYHVAVLLSPVYWAYRASHLRAATLPEIFPGRVTYSDFLWVPCLALMVQTAVLLLLAAWSLRAKDNR